MASPDRPRAALFYAADGFDTSRPRLMGRHAAGEGFLRAWATGAGLDRLVALTETEAEAEAFRRHLGALGATTPAETIPGTGFHRLAETGCLVLPGPGLAAPAWRRRRAGIARGLSLVGVTHTIASAGAMDSLAEQLTAPVEEWDAVVCTSAAVQATVRRLLEDQARWLARRLGATRIEGPLLPVIPLGVACDDLAPAPGARAAWRARLGLGQDDVAVLHHGRLSFHAKAHPLPMLLGLQQAAARVPAPGRLVLVLSGWYADAVQSGAFRAMAAALAPDVRLAEVDGRLPEVRRHVWAAADAFALLSDNIQETFGLAPVEAMAAGLPVVAADWDGLRDTVAHGETGFLLPTTLAGPMHDLAGRHEIGADSYDAYIAGAAQFTAVDVPAAAEAFGALAADATLRARLGAAGRARARALFDWPVVMGRHVALWAELARIRAAARQDRAPVLRGEEPVPHRPDPARLFAAYPTRRLAPETRLALPPGLDAAAVLARIAQLAALPGAVPRRELLPGLDTFEALLAPLAAGPAPVARLAAELPPAAAVRARRALGWLLKADLVRLAPPG